VSFTYTAPGVDDVSTVRFLIGDTDVDFAHLQDEDITYLVTTWLPKNNSLVYVASMAARQIATKYAREVNVSGDGISIDVASLQQKFTDLSRSLMAQYRAEPKASPGGPEAGGIDWAAHRDASVSPPDFGVGMHDNPEAGAQNYGDAPYVLPAQRPDGSP
jgi:hypothetical protein